MPESFPPLKPINWRVSSLPEYREIRRIRVLRQRLANYAHEFALRVKDAQPDTLRALLREMNDIAGAM